MQFGGKADAAQSQAMFDACRTAGITTMPVQLDDSRKPLGLDMLDVFYLHGFDPDTDLRKTMQGFAELRQSGQIRYVGLSNFSAWQIMKAAPIPIISGRTADQLRPSLAAMTYKLDQPLYDRISALSPTPPLATDRSEEQG